jgi:hypothetical protein
MNQEGLSGLGLNEFDGIDLAVIQQHFEMHMRAC